MARVQFARTGFRFENKGEVEDIYVPTSKTLYIMQSG